MGVQGFMTAHERKKKDQLPKGRSLVRPFEGSAPPSTTLPFVSAHAARLPARERCPPPTAPLPQQQKDPAVAGDLMGEVVTGRSKVIQRLLQRT